MTVSETVVWFNSIYELNRKVGEAKSDFSCMLLLDLEQGISGFDVNKCLGITKCDSLSTADRLLDEMEAEGYTVTRKEKAREGHGIVAVCLYRKEKTE